MKSKPASIPFKLITVAIIVQSIFLIVSSVITSTYFDIFQNADNSRYFEYAETVFYLHQFVAHQFLINSAIVIYFICILASFILLSIAIYKKYKGNQKDEVKLMKHIILFAASIVCYPAVMHLGAYCIM